MRLPNWLSFFRGSSISRKAALVFAGWAALFSGSNIAAAQTQPTPTDDAPSLTLQFKPSRLCDPGEYRPIIKQQVLASPSGGNVVVDADSQFLIYCKVGMPQQQAINKVLYGTGTAGIAYYRPLGSWESRNFRPMEEGDIRAVLKTVQTELPPGIWIEPNGMPITISSLPQGFTAPDQSMAPRLRQVVAMLESSPEDASVPLPPSGTVAAPPSDWKINTSQQNNDLTASLVTHSHNYRANNFRIESGRTTAEITVNYDHTRQTAPHIQAIIEVDFSRQHVRRVAISNLVGASPELMTEWLNHGGLNDILKNRNAIIADARAQNKWTVNKGIVQASYVPRTQQVAINFDKPESTIRVADRTQQTDSPTGSVGASGEGVRSVSRGATIWEQLGLKQPPAMSYMSPSVLAADTGADASAPTVSAEPAPPAPQAAPPPVLAADTGADAPAPTVSAEPAPAPQAAPPPVLAADTGADAPAPTVSAEPAPAPQAAPPPVLAADTGADAPASTVSAPPAPAPQATPNSSNAGASVLPSYKSPRELADANTVTPISSFAPSTEQMLLGAVAAVGLAVALFLGLRRRRSEGPVAQAANVPAEPKVPTTVSQPLAQPAELPAVAEQIVDPSPIAARVPEPIKPFALDFSSPLFGAPLRPVANDTTCDPIQTRLDYAKTIVAQYKNAAGEVTKEELANSLDQLMQAVTTGFSTSPMEAFKAACYVLNVRQEHLRPTDHFGQAAKEFATQKMALLQTIYDNRAQFANDHQRLDAVTFVVKNALGSQGRELTGAACTYATGLQKKMMAERGKSSLLRAAA